MSMCPNGHANPDHYRYCGGCGAPLATMGPMASTWSAAQRHSEGPPPPAPSDPSATSAHGSSSTSPGWSTWPRGTQIAVALVGIGLFFGAITIIGTLLAKTGETNSSSNVTTTAAPSLPPSTSDDWERAVCRPGTFANGAGHLRNADSQAQCLSLNGLPIAIGKYTSSFALENDVALFRGTTYATVTTTDGGTWAVIPMTTGGGSRAQSAVEPLRQFGFEMQTVPLSR